MMQGGGNNEAEGSNGTRVTCNDTVLRVLAMILTLVSAIVIGVAKQTKFVQVRASPNLPLMTVPLHAKWHYLSAITFLVVTNCIACGYAATSLLLSMSGKKGLAVMIVTLDLVVMALLFSAIGAAGAVGVLAYKGNPHVKWNKICNVFGRFCHHLVPGVVLSFIGSLAFLSLVLLFLLRSHKKK